MSTWPQYAAIALLAVLVGAFLISTMLGGRQDLGKWIEGGPRDEVFERTSGLTTLLQEVVTTLEVQLD